MPICHIVVPTYNNEQVIPLTLPALFSQSLPLTWRARLIVSDDGSVDSTVATLKQYPAPASWFSTHVVTGPHGGAAGARNRGLSATNADVVLLLGADIILLPGALAAHLNFHAKYASPLAGALGMVKWDPRLNPTPLMEWMAHGGPQNDFDSLLGKTTVDPAHFFYGSHLSLKGSLFNSHSFPENYHSYGWEDLDLGRQLAAHGLILHVLHNAMSLHHHRYTAQGITRRQYFVGENIVVYQKRYPRISLLPKQTAMQKIKHIFFSFSPLRRVSHSLLSVLSRAFSVPWLFSQVTGADFWAGVKKGQNTQFSP